ncbi:putative phosphatidylinositol 4-kinase STT4 like protein, partial [Dictyocoela roeselum]
MEENIDSAWHNTKETSENEPSGAECGQFDNSTNIFDANITFPTKLKNVIFKAGDDCRQDMLALQIISMFKEIFEDANLDIYLHPYRVLSIDKDCGVIEVIENAISRDEMGRERINNLVEYFEFKFGFRESKPYLRALNNFVK